MANQDDLSALLDDALGDFSTVSTSVVERGEGLETGVAGTSNAEPAAGHTSASAGSSGLKFDPLGQRGRASKASATKPADPAPRSEVDPTQDVGLGALDGEELAKGLQKMLAELAGPEGVTPGTRQAGPQGLTAEPQNKDLAATLKALADQAPAFEREGGSQEDVLAQLAAQLGGAGLGEAGEDAADGPEMGSFVDSIMNQLLSKDVLYEPLVEIGAKYPDWLVAHRDELPAEELERYGRQYEHIQRLLKQYETDPEDFGALLDLLQQMQACGQPPKEIVDELAPGGEGLGAEGFPLFGGGAEGSPQGPGDCCVQ
ncbi:PEX19 [Auxenochlorella protothecoides x Auxenochlorella symbiontica]